MRRTLKLAAVALAALSAACSGTPDEKPCEGSGVLCHFAGTGEADFNGDGLPPEQTALYLPSVARPGPDGLIYVMDFNNQRLRCLVSGNVIETVAGSGVHAIAEPNGPALESPLENPIDLGFLPDGRVVFLSLHDPRVLVVEPDGNLASIAGTGEVGDSGDGGPAVDALFNELSAIAVAADGSIYVSDDEAHRVRVIHPDGIVDTVAGTGEKGDSGDGGPAVAAQLNHPQGLSLDADGNLFLADTFNHRIRRVDATTGTIDTVAGTGEGGLSGDGGPATAAQLQWPWGVTVSLDGRLYVADTFNNRIRRVESDGTIVTIAGSSEGHEGDGGPATAAQLRGPAYLSVTEDALYIADMQNQVVRLLHLR